MSPPATSHPHGLWSLWDMLERHAFLFAKVASNLTVIVGRCTLAKMQTPDPVAWAYNDPNLNLPRETLMELRRALILSDMQEVLPQLDRVEALAKNSVLIDRLAGDMDNLILRVFDDLSNQFYFHVDQRDVPFYGQKEPFGPKVAAKFPKAQPELERAGNCIALQQSTAAVFHLMRAMEVVVQRLGKKLGVANVEKEWGKILSDIHGAIEKMPKGDAREKAKRNGWSEAHANLYHVKQAWRNDTMHPKETYDRHEALEVYSATRTFMTHLAGLV